jgi:hypothetical protein
MSMGVVHLQHAPDERDLGGDELLCDGAG